jgi:LPS-assembly protein
VGRFGYGSVRLAATETAYLLNNDLVGDGPRSLPDRQNREQLTLRSEVGSIFQRIYDVHRFGLAKVKHTIEPSLGYFYVPSVGQADLPLWDGIDRINHRNLLTYGVSSRLLGKAEDDAEPSNGNGVRELARVSLVQSYDISRAILPLKQRATQDHFSDIDLGGRVNPNRFFSLRFLTNFDAAGGDFSATKVGFFIEDPRDEDDSDQTRRLDTRTSAGVSYRFLTNNLLHQVDANVVLRLTDTIGFIYASRYNVVAQQFLDNFFGLRLISSCDCWALDLAITNRTNPNETEARAQLTLVGLSSEKRARRAAVMP